jgi:hypothetical protein
LPDDQLSPGAAKKERKAVMAGRKKQRSITLEFEQRRIELASDHGNRTAAIDIFPKHREICTADILITPGIAAVLLERNNNNRNIDPRRIAAGIRDIGRGAWTPGTDSIGFGAEGSLYNGQHRLWLVVITGASSVYPVRFNLPPEARHNIDKGRTRSVSDDWKMLDGYERAGDVSAWMGAVEWLLRTSAFLSHADRTEMREKYAAEIQWAKMAIPGSRGLSTSCAIGPLILGYRKYPDQTAEFAEQYIGGEDLNTGDPALALRNSALGVNGGPRTRGKKLAQKTLAALRAHVEGRRIRKIVTKPQDDIRFFLTEAITEQRDAAEPTPLDSALESYEEMAASSDTQEES